MNKLTCAEVFVRFHAANPEPQGELQYGSPFQLLIAVILSAQATDISVNKATQTLFAVAPTPEALLALGEAGLIEHIRTIGLYRAKAKNILITCRQLLEHFDGKVPERREDLETLAGVGRKTANVVLNIAFGQPTLAVDTHVFRVANRTGLAPGKTPLEVELKLLKRIPETYRRHAHHWLILHGRYVCKARKPDCPACLIHDLCEYPGRDQD